MLNNLSSMTKWEPISFDKLYDMIIRTESELLGEVENLWKLIRIPPEKWQEKEYGEEGGGFWVVALVGKEVIWYNDIEDGFDIGEDAEYGRLLRYSGGQNYLVDLIKRINGRIKYF